MTTQLTELDGFSRRPVIRRAIAWLLFLGPFFYLTYGTANWLASLHDDVPNLAFNWEGHVPFIAWSIIPYWSVNLFYAIALFVNDSPEQVDRLAKCYLTAQIIAVLCFVAFPLTATFVKPETSSLPGFMFDVLGGFDKPFNQAPSPAYRAFDHYLGSDASRDGRCNACGLACLVSADRIIGANHLSASCRRYSGRRFARAVCSVAFPTQHTLTSGRVSAYIRPEIPAYRLVLSCGGNSFSCAGCSWSEHHRLCDLLVWPATALALVALGYFGAGAGIFEKQTDGAVSLASRLLLWPYRLFARLNIRFWTRKLPAHVELGDNVFLGRFPKARELQFFSTVIDLAPEMVPPAHSIDWKSYGSHRMRSKSHAITVRCSSVARWAFSAAPRLQPIGSSTRAA